MSYKRHFVFTYSALLCVSLWLLYGIVYNLGFSQFSNEPETASIIESSLFSSEAFTTETSINISGHEVIFINSSKKDGEETLPWGSKIVFIKNDVRLFTAESGTYFSGIFIHGDCPEDPGWFIENAETLKRCAVQDVNNNGIPDIAFTLYTGGVHCCSENYVFELGELLTPLLALNTWDARIEFVDLNKDKTFEIETFDATFAYWNSSFTGSPAPRVVLSLQNGTYKADPKFMQKAPPTKAELKSAVANIEASEYGLPLMWEYLLDLIYSGNETSAKEYVDLAWERDLGHSKESFTSKENFWVQFKKQLQESQFYEDLSPDLIDIEELPR